MNCALTPETVEDLLGPSTGVLHGLLTPRPCADGGPGARLCLDVLVHAAAAEGGMIVGPDGHVVESLGLEGTTVASLAAASRGGLPRCLDCAQLVGPNGLVTYTSLGLPVFGGSTLVLATTGQRGSRVDIDAMLAVLPGVACALQGIEIEWRRAG